MSYAEYDHAGWAESNLRARKSHMTAAAIKKCQGKRFSGPTGYGGSPDKLNDFQRQVFDIIGIAGGGIYNAPISWESIVWGGDSYMRVTWRGDMATWDGCALAKIVWLCQECCIRLCIEGATNGYVWLTFHPRKSREGGIGERLPSAEQFHAFMRQYAPLKSGVFQHRPYLPGFVPPAPGSPPPWSDCLPFAIARGVAELPDRSSPENDPEMMMVTTKELKDIVRRAIDSAYRGSCSE